MSGEPRKTVPRDEESESVLMTSLETLIQMCLIPDSCRNSLIIVYVWLFFFKFNSVPFNQLI